MSAAVLREAAALMRERAELAPDGPWIAGERCVWGALPGHEVVSDGPDGKGGASTSLGADHIASWHPAVALAVADWLEATADEPWCCDECKYAPDNHNALVERAVATARAYLGTTK